MAIDRAHFFTTVRPMFGGRLTQGQVDGMNAILDDWEARMPDADVRWLAYALATARHETAHTMLPVREAFWLSEDWRRRNLSYWPYYGRGYVQLTHRNNYLKAGNFVGADLVNNYDAALRPDYAATIMFVGMTQGWFRRDANGPHTFERYFNSSTDDPVRARRIINGFEPGIAEDIAEYYSNFLRAVGARVLHMAAPERDFSAGIMSIAATDAVLRPMASAPKEDEALNTAGDVRQMVTDIVAAYVSNNQIAPDVLPGLVANVFLALSRAPYVSARIADDSNDEGASQSQETGKTAETEEEASVTPLQTKKRGARAPRRKAANE
ncbi:MucR family transcriptional regulator [Rhizobiaceae bacterium n13]|uniref:glycoside hydrolase family 19 protein n=1 Tax=Ferirhizobium litorale TaxID=2927786 RepID=UPI0024B31165|nr:glycoside hydrolase family 19 protein [Fererhizobium litorale]MDI7865304.1 MucR family transcriptional regulator [Fererhizobium litorale]